MAGVARFVPGFPAIAGLSAGDIPRELLAGASVAAVAIPIGLAYAALVGLPPQYGLYASIAPTIAYALFGPSSRFLIVGPDSSVCLLLGATLTTIGAVGAERAGAAAGVTLLVGVACVVAGLLRLGFIANLISKPVLVGYLSGASITLLVGQLASFSGVHLEAHGVLRQIAELARRAAEIHWPTLVLAVSLFAGLRFGKALAPKIPGPAVAIVLAIFLSWLADLAGGGMAIIGTLPPGLPLPALPVLAGDPRQLALAVLGVVIVSFSSGILTARSFAARLGRADDANRELGGFGAANIAAGLFQGFAVTGADSRTAIALAAGGRTPLTGVAAGLAVALVLTLLAAPLALLPQAALGAILASAAVDLFDARAYARLFRIDRVEFVIALIATAGVIWIGVFVAVGLTLAHLLQQLAKPRDARMGRLPDSGELVTLQRYRAARPPERIVVYLFEASILFVNADYFGRRALAALRKEPGAGWFVLDASAMMNADSAAVDALAGLKDKLDRKGVTLLIGGGHGNFREVLDRSGLAAIIGHDRLFASPAAALAAAEKMRDAGTARS
jgi:high affinity sulfate transporter 1